MNYKKITDTFTIIWKGKQKIGFIIDDIKKPLYVNPKFVFNQTGIAINEIELLIGSYFEPTFFKVGDKFYNGKIFQKTETKIVKSFHIIMDGSVAELREKNRSYLKNYKEIIKVFQFTRNEKTTVGLDIGEEKAVFISSSRLKGITTLDLNEIHILEGSFILPEYFNIGENIFEGINEKTEYCRKSGVILKNLNLRFFGKIEEMHEKYENSEPECVTTNDDYRYDSNNWLEDLAGTDDPEVMRDVYWNID